MEVWRHAGSLRYDSSALQVVSNQGSLQLTDTLLCLPFLVSNSGPRWQPSFSHQVCFPVYRKEGTLGKGVHANWSSEGWHYFLHLIRQHLGLWLHIITKKHKKQFLFSFFLPLGRHETELFKKKIQYSITMKEKRKCIGSHPAVSDTLSPIPLMNHRDMGWNFIEESLNEAERGSFIFCPHFWPKGKFVLFPWGMTFLPLSRIYSGAHSCSLKC